MSLSNLNSYNWASEELGAKLIDYSSQVTNCDASNVLNNNIETIWLSQFNLPQWLCISLDSITNKRDVVIRTIGWYCWHPYKTNPKVVAIHVSSDGSKFKLWDTLIATDWKGAQLFCCAPISVAIYSFIAIEVTDNFGGNQTYMNRLFFFSDEVVSSPHISMDGKQSLQNNSAFFEIANQQAVYTNLSQSMLSTKSIHTAPTPTTKDSLNIHTDAITTELNKSRITLSDVEKNPLNNNLNEDIDLELLMPDKNLSDSVSQTLLSIPSHNETLIDNESPNMPIPSLSSKLHSPKVTESAEFLSFNSDRNEFVNTRNLNLTQILSLPDESDDDVIRSSTDASIQNDPNDKVMNFYNSIGTTESTDLAQISYYPSTNRKIVVESSSNTSSIEHVEKSTSPFFLNLQMDQGTSIAKAQDHREKSQDHVENELKIPTELWLEDSFRNQSHNAKESKASPGSRSIHDTSSQLQTSLNNLAMMSADSKSSIITTHRDSCKVSNENSRLNVEDVTSVEMENELYDINPYSLVVSSVDTACNDSMLDKISNEIHDEPRVTVDSSFHGTRNMIESKQYSEQQPSKSQKPSTSASSLSSRSFQNNDDSKMEESDKLEPESKDNKLHQDTYKNKNDEKDNYSDNNEKYMKFNLKSSDICMNSSDILNYIQKKQYSALVSLIDSNNSLNREELLVVSRQMENIARSIHDKIVDRNTLLALFNEERAADVEFNQKIRHLKKKSLQLRS